MDTKNERRPSLAPHPVAVLRISRRSSGSRCFRLHCACNAVAQSPGADLAWRERAAPNRSWSRTASPAATKRDRVLSDEEAITIWCAAGEAPSPYGGIVRLL